MMNSDLRIALADVDMPRRWSFRLPPPLEARFLAETEMDRNARLRFWLGVMLAFNWLTFGVDVLTVPDVWPLALLLRMGVVTPVVVLVMDLLGRAPPHRLAPSLAPLGAGIGIIAVLVVLKASRYDDPFRDDIILSLGVLWVNVLAPLRPRDAVLFTVLMLGLGDVILHHEVLRGGALAHPDMLSVLHGLAAVSLLVRFQAERESRRNFLVGLRLRLRADDLARSNAKLLEMSNTDPLTGLANRRFLDAALARIWAEAAPAGRIVGAIMVDVDHFKPFNDALGHQEGDRCLAVVARTIAGQVRDGADLAARFGGEEFLVLMPDAEPETARLIAERVRTAVAALRLVHPGEPQGGYVTVSVGVALMRAGAGDPAALVAAADAALYAAKSGGRNRVAMAGAPVMDIARA